MEEPPAYAATAAAEQPEAACERCGRPEASCFGDRTICDACYSESGSCCAGEEE